MTIKEVEARTGLTRANIRYYEGEGFFSAARGENGYRDYSEENVDTLLKIKLLRQLGFSLEDIRAVQSGEEALGRALERREAGLAEEQKELDRAARLCRELRDDGADFYTLDARRYLEEFPGQAGLTEDQDQLLKSHWRRWVAQEGDLFLYTVLLALTAQFVFRVNVLRTDRLLFVLGGMLMMWATETVLLPLTGATPGKKLMGLKVLREDGSRLSLPEAALRTTKMTFCFGLPTLAMVAGSYSSSFGQLHVQSFLWAVYFGVFLWMEKQVKQGKTLPWEGNSVTCVDHRTQKNLYWNMSGGRRYLMGLTALLLIFGLVWAGDYISSRPPHRASAMTVEEFVENFNQIAAYEYGENRVPRYLTADGTFEEKYSGAQGNLYGPDQMPTGRFEFHKEDDRLIQVIYREEYDSGHPTAEGEGQDISVPFGWFSHMMRAFLGSYLSDRKISSIQDELYRYQWNLTREMKGVQVRCETETAGYELRTAEYLAQPGQRQRYELKFTMTILEP